MLTNITIIFSQVREYLFPDMQWYLKSDSESLFLTTSCSNFFLSVDTILNEWFDF